MWDAEHRTVNVDVAAPRGHLISGSDITAGTGNRPRGRRPLRWQRGPTRPGSAASGPLQGLPLMTDGWVGDQPDARALRMEATYDLGSQRVPRRDSLCTRSALQDLCEDSESLSLPGAPTFLLLK